MDYQTIKLLSAPFYMSDRQGATLHSTFDHHCQERSVTFNWYTTLIWHSQLPKLFFALFLVGYYTGTFGFMTIACIAVSPIFGYIADYFKTKLQGNNIIIYSVDSAIQPAFLVKRSSNLELLHRNTWKILTRKAAPFEEIAFSQNIMKHTRLYSHWLM